MIFLILLLVCANTLRAKLLAQTSRIILIFSVFVFEIIYLSLRSFSFHKHPVSCLIIVSRLTLKQVGEELCLVCTNRLPKHCIDCSFSLEYITEPIFAFCDTFILILERKICEAKHDEEI